MAHCAPDLHPEGEPLTTVIEQSPRTPLPRGVLFDMDGILVDTEPVHALAYAAAFRSAGLALEPEDYRRHVTLNGGSIRELFRERGGDPTNWEQVFQHKCDRFQRHVAEELVLLPGVESLLAALREHGIPSVLATGSSRFNAEVVLSRFGLHPYFHAVLTGEDVQRTKPDPEVFLKAAAALSVAPAECVCIEDSPKGARAAAVAGVPCVIVPTDWTRGQEFPGAVLVMDTLTGVTPALLAQLLAGAKEGATRNE